MKGFIEILQDLPEPDEYTVTHSDRGRAVDVVVTESNESVEYDVFDADSPDDIALSVGITLRNSNPIPNRQYRFFNPIFDGDGTDEEGRVVKLKIWEELPEG